MLTHLENNKVDAQIETKVNDQTSLKIGHMDQIHHQSSLIRRNLFSTLRDELYNLV